MTVNIELPKISYTGNGNTVDYTFDWSCGDPNENFVNLNGKRLIEGVEYELEDFTLEFGGTMRFNIPPAIDDSVFIFRQTPITQQVDYIDGDAFPADTHEFQCDKDTRILQELFFGGVAFGGEVDLDSVPHETFVEITNTAGRNAEIQPWTTDGLLAGISMGEVILDGAPTPTDGSPTTKPDGYIWWILGPAAAAGGNPNIVMFTNAIVLDGSKVGPQIARAEFRYNSETGNVEYGYDELQPLVLPLWTTEVGISPAPVALLEYWIRFDMLSGAVDNGSFPTGVWIDAYSTSLNVNKYMNWFVADPGASQAVTGTFTIAPDNGGIPDMQFAIARNIDLTANQT